MTTALDTVRYECGIAGEEIADMVDSLEKENDQLREQVSALQRSIDFDLVQAQQETIDKLRNDVEMLRDVLNTVYKLVPDLVPLMQPSALAATEPKP